MNKVCVKLTLKVLQCPSASDKRRVSKSFKYYYKSNRQKANEIFHLHQKQKYCSENILGFSSLYHQNWTTITSTCPGSSVGCRCRGFHFYQFFQKCRRSGCFVHGDVIVMNYSLAVWFLVNFIFIVPALIILKTGAFHILKKEILYIVEQICCVCEVFRILCHTKNLPGIFF